MAGFFIGTLANASEREGSLKAVLPQQGELRGSAGSIVNFESQGMGKGAETKKSPESKFSFIMS